MSNRDDSCEDDDFEDFEAESEIEEDEGFYQRWCRHGCDAGECEACDDEIEAEGGIDKCLNCGRYKSGNQLNRDQVCKIPCRNPNEY